LLNHGFTGQSEVLGEVRIILLDSDGCLRSNIDRASEAPGHLDSHTSRDIESISEDNYGKAKADYEAYRQSMGQAKEVHNLRSSGQQKTAALSVVEANDDGAGHWVSEVHFYDTSGKSPRFVYKRSGDQPEKIYDQERFEKYRLKALGQHEALLGGRYRRQPAVYLGRLREGDSEGQGKAEEENIEIFELAEAVGDCQWITKNGVRRGHKLDGLQGWQTN
jgi:hypothetical protein